MSYKEMIPQKLYMMLLAHAIFFLLIQLSCSVRVLDLRVPELIDVRDVAILTCTYDLEGEQLNSLKWYKEELEFYRYMPRSVPEVQTFAVDGVKVVETKSNVTVIMLSPLEYESSGEYKCEVSSDRPHFKIAMKSSNMSVLALPRGEPRIEGIRESYLLGDYVEGNCTSSPSYPLAEVRWLINGKKARDWFVEPYKPVQIKDALRQEYRTVGLRFQVDASHYADKNQMLTLTCQETFAGKTKSRVAAVQLSKLMTNQKFAQEQLNKGDETPAVKELIVLAVLLLLSL